MGEERWSGERIEMTVQSPFIKEDNHTVQTVQCSAVHEMLIRVSDSLLDMTCASLTL